MHVNSIATCHAHTTGAPPLPPVGGTPAGPAVPSPAPSGPLVDHDALPVPTNPYPHR